MFLDIVMLSDFSIKIKKKNIFCGISFFWTKRKRNAIFLFEGGEDEYISHDIYSERKCGASSLFWTGLSLYGGRIRTFCLYGVVECAPPFLSWFYSFSETGTVNYSLLGWVAIFSPLILIFMISKALNQLNVVKAQGFFWLFSALMGVSFGNVFLLFSGSDIFQAFLVT